MGSAPAILEVVGQSVWRASWQASALAVAVLAAVTLWRGRLSPAWRYVLWSLVLVRLLLPLAPPARWSPYNLAEGLGERIASCRARDGRRTRAPGPGPRRRRCRPLAVDGLRAAGRADPHGTDARRVIRDAGSCGLRASEAMAGPPILAGRGVDLAPGRHRDGGPDRAERLAIATRGAGLAGDRRSPRPGAAGRLPSPARPAPTGPPLRGSGRDGSGRRRCLAAADRAARSGPERFRPRSSRGDPAPRARPRPPSRRRRPLADDGGPRPPLVQPDRVARPVADGGGARAGVR